MSIRHTVVFRLRHESGSQAEQDFILAAQSTLSSIRTVHDFRVSRQVGPHSDAAFQFAMTFDDQECYDAYNADPRHQNFVATRWSSEVESFQEFDFIGY